MTKILAIDASTEACSCALLINGVVHEEYRVIPRQHTNQLLPMIQSLLSEHSLAFEDLDAIAVGHGPGSFTGLRIAIGVAQGIAFGADLPVIGVSTLAAIALELHASSQCEFLLSCMDARIGEIYWGSFQIVNKLPVALGSEKLCTPENVLNEFPDSGATIAAGGTGLNYLTEFSESLRAKLSYTDAELLPRAGSIATLAEVNWQQQQFCKAELLKPVYIRDKVTYQKLDKQ